MSVCVCMFASEMKQIGFKNVFVIQMRNDGPGSECLASYSQGKLSINHYYSRKSVLSAILYLVLKVGM